MYGVIFAGLTWLKMMLLMGKFRAWFCSLRMQTMSILSILSVCLPWMTIFCVPVGCCFSFTIMHAVWSHFCPIGLHTKHSLAYIYFNNQHLIVLTTFLVVLKVLHTAEQCCYKLPNSLATYTNCAFPSLSVIRIRIKFSKYLSVNVLLFATI